MIHFLFQIFIYIIIIDVVLSYIPDLKGQKWAQIVHKIADTPQKPIRDLLPKGLPFDITPMVLIFIIQLILMIIT